VRFQDVDAAGIIFFSRYFEYAHTAFIEWLRVAGIEVGQMFERREFGMPLVHAEADFHAPSRFDDELLVGVEVARLGETSIGFAFPIVAAAGGEKRATVRTTHVCIDLTTFRPKPWPAAYRARLAAAGGVD
jgi:YbgC/YbaW family acyl-CoA thioester hydrolase